MPQVKPQGHPAVYLIDMLTARAAGMVDILAIVVRLQIDFNIFRFGHDHHGRRRRVDAALRFRFGPPLHAMPATFVLQFAVDSFALRRDRDLLEPAQLGGAGRQDLELPLLRLAMLLVHFKQVAGEQSRFVAPGPGPYLHDAPAAVGIFAAERQLQQLVPKRIPFSLQFGQLRFGQLAHLQVVAGPGQVRRDGELRASATVEHPGVVITAETREHGTLVYETDVFGPRWGVPLSEAWKDNLRAITLGLESLRRVERYGIATRGQQYAGFRELGAGIAMGAAMTEARARREVGLDPDEDFDAEYLKRMLIDGAKNLHPDAGGDPEAFAEFKAAIDFLRDLSKVAT